MKRHCKKVEIERVEFVEQAVFRFLQGKTTRRKIGCFISKFTGYPLHLVQDALEHKNELLYKLTHAVAWRIAGDLRARSLNLRPITYKERLDPSSLKTRRIGVQNVYQCILDHVAVLALQQGGLTARVGEWQCASIPGRGCVMGAQRVAKWLRSKNARYCVKLDVKKCYEHIRPAVLMDFYRSHIKNPALVWLLEQLLATHQGGLSIGSYLSQWSCNILLSQLWHFMAQSARIQKRGKVVRLYYRQLYYMDDLLFLGRNKRHLAKAATMAVDFLATLGLTVKPWQIQPAETVDMMGFKCHPGYCTIRRRIWRRARRTFLRASAQLLRGPHMALTTARALTSYHSYFKHSASLKITGKYGARHLLTWAGGLISQTSKHTAP